MGTGAAATEAQTIPIQNAQIAEQLERLADVLEIEGENPFRVRAYRNAAFTIRAQTRPLADLVDAGEDLSALHGIGDAIARKIAELVRTGHLRALDGLEAREEARVPAPHRVPWVEAEPVAKRSLSASTSRT